MRSTVSRSLMRARPGRGATAGVGVAAAAGALYAPFNVAFQSTTPSLGAFLLVTFVSGLLAAPAAAAWGALALHRSRGALVAGYAASITAVVAVAASLLPDLFMMPPTTPTQALLTLTGAGIGSLIAAYWLTAERHREVRTLRPGQSPDPSLVPSPPGAPGGSAHLTGPAGLGGAGGAGFGGGL